MIERMCKTQDRGESMHIPFNRAYEAKKSMEYIKQVIESGRTGADGRYTHLCKAFLEERLGSNHILMTTSCTHALELALDLISLDDGDEVIMPSYTFPSTANCVLIHHGRVVFTEVNEDDLCMNMERIEEKITERTKAILVVHYGGNACDMDQVMAIAKKYDLYVIEDAAQGLFSTYKGQALGTIGHFGCYSFHETKNISAGEGGALSINTLALDTQKKAAYIRQKGTNRIDYTRGEVAYYEWVEKGSSYCPSELVMAYLYSQLEESDKIHKNRLALFHTYRALLQELQSDTIAYYATGNGYGAFNGHIFYIIFHREEDAYYFITAMKDYGIDVYTHFVPLHMSQMGKKLGYGREAFPYETSLKGHLVRLPLYPHMSEEEIGYIQDAIRSVVKQIQDREGGPYENINGYSCI